MTTIEAQGATETKTTVSPTTEPDFSLVAGGLLFRIFRQTHLSGPTLEWLKRRALVVTLFVWLPLLLLSLVEGHALRGAIKIPFMRDVEAHSRFLVTVPLLIVAEVTVQHRIGPAVRDLISRGIVTTQELPKLAAAISSAARIRDSFAAEALVILFIYSFGLWFWRTQIALGTATWYAIPQTSHMNLTLAGYWYAYISIPVFQFVLLRWYFRLCLWIRFLWQVSRLKLRLRATHPDLAGGIGFLGKISYSFCPFLFAQGAMLSGLIASRVLYGGRTLQSFRMEAIGYVGFFLLIVLGPLAMFTSHLLRTEFEGRDKYGSLANQYVSQFEEKWLEGGTPGADQLLGTADIQSLADLANSYAVIRQMRIVPFGLDDVIRLAATTAAPLLPLGLIILSPAELVNSLIKVLFR
jgi:hypothetical protein